MDEDKSNIRQTQIKVIDIQDNGGNKMSKNLEVSEKQKGSGPKKSSLYLIVSEECNLGCTYCLEKTNEVYKAVNCLMNANTAIRAIDLYWEMFNLSKRSTESTITFYGGEALMNPRVVIESAEYIRELDRKHRIETNIIVNTNGTLVTEELAQKAKALNIMFVVSLDGSVAVNDRCRKDLRGEGSFDRVVKGMKILKDAGVETLMSTVLTPFNLNDANDLLAIAKELEIKKILVSPLMGDTIKRIDKNARVKEYAQKAAVSALKYYEEAEKIGIQELQTGARKKAFLSGVPVSSEAPDIGCSLYGGSYIVVWPNENISICEHIPDLKIGNLNTSVEELTKNKNKMIKNLKQRLPSSNEECKGCEFKKICAGGCAYSALLARKDLMKRDPLSCEYSKKLYELFGKRR